MKSYQPATRDLSTAHRLEQICMSSDKRRIARASMQQAEFIADLIMRANQDLRHVFGLLQRTIRGLWYRSKVSAVTPEWRLP